MIQRIFFTTIPAGFARRHKFSVYKYRQGDRIKNKPENEK